MNSHEVAAKKFQLLGTDSAPHHSDGIMTDLLLLLHTEPLFLRLSPFLLLPSEPLLFLQSTPLLLLSLPFPLLLLLPPTLLFFFSEAQQRNHFASLEIHSCWWLQTERCPLNSCRAKPATHLFLSCSSFSILCEVT